MDTTFITGLAAVVSALIVFCGGIWLLLAVVMGSRLAYFITASITLAFLFMMGLVWSTTQLGPVGVLPTFRAEAIGESPQAVEFGAATSYPGGDWREIDEADEAELEKQTELEGSAGDYLGDALERGDIDTYESSSDAQVVAGSARLLQQGGNEFGAVLFQPMTGEGQEAPEVNAGDPDTVLVVMRFDPGNPLGLARSITIGTLLLFIAHLFGLSRAERRAKALREKFA